MKRVSGSSRDGFALIIALSLMSFVLLLLLSMATLVRVENRSASINHERLNAEQSALLGLNVALGQLQVLSGADQRVTATADLFTETGNNEPAVGNSRWMGVWSGEDYDPSNPDNKRFLGWLVSSAQLQDQLDAVSQGVGASGVTIFEGETDLDSVRVPKIDLDRSAYAFWIEDEGVKADLGWQEGNFGVNERQQSSRLAVSAGPDYGDLGGPFDGKVAYPIEYANNTWLEAGRRVTNVEDWTFALNSGSDAAQWLKETRHHFTSSSLGVLADMKLGGLKRDLSLAFEMDGSSDTSSTSFPSLFSQQAGEFTGGTDRLAGQGAIYGMRGYRERFLYRDTKTSGSVFSNDIANNYAAPYWASVRGPNWWMLRDYANLYKRLRLSGGDYVMPARSYYPNESATDIDSGYIPARNNARYNLASLARAEYADDTNSGHSVWNAEINKDDDYIYRPATGNVAPVTLGAVCYFSLALSDQGVGVSGEAEGKLNLIADPAFYLWNPYNRAIEVERFAIVLPLGFAGGLTFHVSGSTTNETYGPNDFNDYIAGSTGATAMTYYLENVTLEPGEVIVASPPSGDASKNSSLELGYQYSTSTGLVVDKFSQGNWNEVIMTASDSVRAEFTTAGFSSKDSIGKRSHSRSNRIHTSLPEPGTTVSSLSSISRRGENLQALDFWIVDNEDDGDYIIDVENDPTFTFNELSVKTTFAAIAYLALPSDSDSAVEIFSQFNPSPIGSTERAFDRRCDPNFTFRAVCFDGDFDAIHTGMELGFPQTSRNHYWGKSHENGYTHVPISDISSTPLYSLVQFANASLTTRTFEPFQAVGNSFASVFVTPTSPYGSVQDDTNGITTAADASWLLNDALFDRYYLSGIAPDFSINGGGYQANGTLRDTLSRFFDSDYTQANASPVMRPYLPDGVSVDSVLDDLDDNSEGKGYLKMGAYSLVNGMFNVNSTSVEAWAALLKANKDLDIAYVGNGANSDSGTPFPGGTAPVDNTGSAEHWSGFSRLSDAEINELATQIVDQVKQRGPFMSLSDFVNHRVGGNAPTDLHQMGAIQAAIEASRINLPVQSGADGVRPDYQSGAFSPYYKNGVFPIDDRKSTTGIAGDITQAKILQPLAPRLNARSDTFKIRAYGEARSADGSQITSSVVCEAVVQRLPEYLDPDTDANNNEPWDEARPNPLSYTLSSGSSNLNALNAALGRRYKIISLTWLEDDEV